MNCHIVFQNILIKATTVVTLPVLEFSIVISLALVKSMAILVALIRLVSVDSLSMPTGLSHLRCLSTWIPGLLEQLSHSLLESLSDKSRACSLASFLDLAFFFSQA
jgi:hypothetical protein